MIVQPALMQYMTLKNIKAVKNRLYLYLPALIANKSSSSTLTLLTRENRSFCKEKGIRLSGPKLGRPNPATAKTDKKKEYQDNTDRIEVEREFSREKRCYGMGRIVTKLEETQLTSIALSVFVANLFKIQRRILCALFYQYKIFKLKTVWLSPCWT